MKTSRKCDGGWGEDDTFREKLLWNFVNPVVKGEGRGSLLENVTRRRGQGRGVLTSKKTGGRGGGGGGVGGGGGGGGGGRGTFNPTGGWGGGKVPSRH